ncbi:hypothetical protein, partial [Gluconacetobacter sp.]|uniref:hypothetical protein n=1 Tax=Gluconacetobacter sp. TaxID=1935994 RepID=UPI0039EA8DE8
SKTTDYESARCIHAETIRRSAWNGIKNYHSSLPLYTLPYLKYFFFSLFRITILGSVLFPSFSRTNCFYG